MTKMVPKSGHMQDAGWREESGENTSRKDENMSMGMGFRSSPTSCYK